MCKKIDIDKIPGVFKVSALITIQVQIKATEEDELNAELKREPKEDLLISDTESLIAYYKEMLKCSRGIYTEACITVVNLLESMFSELSSRIEDLNDQGKRKFIKSLRARLIGQLSFREKDSQAQEQKLIYIEAMESIEVIFANYLYK